MISAIVVLTDGMLTTWKATNSCFQGIDAMISLVKNLGSQYFPHEGSVQVIGKFFDNMEEVDDWWRSFGAHPGNKPTFYSSVFCKTEEEWNASYDGTGIPFGTPGEYSLREGEINVTFVVENFIERLSKGAVTWPCPRSLS